MTSPAKPSLLVHLVVGTGLGALSGLLLWRPSIGLLGPQVAPAVVGAGLGLGAAALCLLLRRRRRTLAIADTLAQAGLSHAIVETATEGIATIDTSGRLTSVNAAAGRMFGYDPAVLIGQNVRMLMPEPYSSEHDGYLANYLRTGEAHIIGIGREVQGRRRDGTVFPIDLSVGEGREGGLRFFVAIIRDISERYEMRNKLALAERLAAVGELAAGVAHEVNNPINTVINCAQLIEDGDDPQENATIIAEEGQRIATIVADLLRFARGDREEPEPTSLDDVVGRTIRLMAENLARSGIRVAVTGVPTAPVMARGQQLQQVLLNLVINAKDALQQDAARRGPGHITIHLADEDDGVALYVRDDGPGIPEKLRGHVFEPFVTSKRGRGGTGLGLSISKSIVEGFGGSLTLRSEPGKGAEFRAWLPHAGRGAADGPAPD